MKKFIGLFLILFLLTACTFGATTAKSAVEDYLNSYRNLATDVMNDMEEVIQNEQLSEEQKNIYRDILKRQYKDLKFEIINEKYSGNDAVVKTKINVYNLYKVQKDAADYLKNNIKEFYDNAGKYDNNLYLNYKLNRMKTTTERVDYTIDFNVIKKDDGWKIKEISSTDLEKIHGIYNYELD
jgi:hypothetical protein